MTALAFIGGAIALLALVGAFCLGRLTGLDDAGRGSEVPDCHGTDDIHWTD